MKKGKAEQDFGAADTFLPPTADDLHAIWQAFSGIVNDHANCNGFDLNLYVALADGGLSVSVIDIPRSSPRRLETVSRFGVHYNEAARGYTLTMEIDPGFPDQMNFSATPSDVSRLQLRLRGEIFAALGPEQGGSLALHLAAQFPAAGPGGPVLH